MPAPVSIRRPRGVFEIVFTDENKSGQFIFVPNSPVTALNNQLVSVTRLVKYASEVIYQNAARNPGLLPTGNPGTRPQFLC